MIKSTTTLTGLFGHPIKHSLSPLIHNYVYQKLNIDSVYLCFDISADLLKEAVHSLKALNFKGVNVTIPYKQKIIPYLSELDKEAKIINAVNTIKVKGKKLVGYNTDARGFLKALKKKCRFDPQNCQALILGCGGAGWAVSVALCTSNAREISLYDINHKRTQKLVRHLKNIFGKVTIKGYKKLTDINLRKFQLLVNATPVGMKNEAPPINIEEVSKKCVIYDLVYNPPLTPLIKKAQQLGIRAYNGLSMLVYQAEESERIWFDKKTLSSSNLMFEILKNAGFYT